MFEMVDASIDNRTGKPYPMSLIDREQDLLDIEKYTRGPQTGKRYTDIMVDLETLDTCPSAAILSIGAVAFNIDEPETVKEYLYGVDCTARSFDRVVNLEDQHTHHQRTISADTFRWWLNQSEEARAPLILHKGQNINSALYEFSEWVQRVSLGNPRMWGNGAAFDNAILRDAYTKCGGDHPIRYNKDMCYRTMKAMFMPGQVEVPDQNLLTAHNARHDAIFQAVILQKIWANWGTKLGTWVRTNGGVQ